MTSTTPVDTIDWRKEIQKFIDSCRPFSEDGFKELVTKVRFQDILVSLVKLSVDKRLREKEAEDDEDLSEDDDEEEDMTTGLQSSRATDYNLLFSAARLALTLGPQEIRQECVPNSTAGNATTNDSWKFLVKVAQEADCKLQELMITQILGLVVKNFISLEDANARKELVEAILVPLFCCNVTGISEQTSKVVANQITSQEEASKIFKEGGLESTMIKIITEERSLKSEKYSSPHKDTVRLAAAVALLSLAKESSFASDLAVENRWMNLIVETFYNTPDFLLKLSAAQIIIDEMGESPAGRHYLWNEKNYLHFLPELQGSETTMVNSSLRLICSMIEQIPESKTDVLRAENHIVINTVKKLLDMKTDVSSRSAGISAVGCVLSGRDNNGCQILNQHLPGWISELRTSLERGSEAECMALLTALIRIYGGIDEKGAESKVPLHESLIELEAMMTPPVLSGLRDRPFAAMRELSFIYFQAVTDCGITTPIEKFCINTELQLVLFAPIATDPPSLKSAKHGFVRRAWNQFGRFIVQNASSKQFSDSVEFYAKAISPYSTPPAYRNVSEMQVEELAL